MKHKASPSNLGSVVPVCGSVVDVRFDIGGEIENIAMYDRLLKVPRFRPSECCLQQLQAR